MAQTHIIILNWNGGKETWQCVRSVCALPDAEITILDNASTDDSVEHIQRGLSELKVAYQTVDASQAAAFTGHDIVRILLSGTNLGFAAGINLVLRNMRKEDQPAYIWLLNNDAIATPDTLPQLVAAMEQAPRAGFAGSLILDAHRPGEIQCFGVRYHKWLGVGKMLFKGADISSLEPETMAAMPADFQHGASLMVRMQTIHEVGMLDERFFLYSEEHDWQKRAQHKAWTNIRVPGSQVSHLGSLSTARNRHLFYYHYCRSSVIYSRKHHKGIVAIVASLMLTLITMIRTRLHLRSFGWAMKGIQEAWRISL